MKRRTFTLSLASLAALPALGKDDEKRPASPAKPELVSVKKIWDRAPHNAFTDLIKFKGEWICVFREGQNHVSSDGLLRVLVSRDDGESWDSSAVVIHPGSDLRDAKITITPDNRLMLSGAGALHPPSPYTHQSYVWFSDDGRKWGPAIAVADPNVWLWRTTWHKGGAYGVGYGCGKDPSGQFARLYSSKDGGKFDTHVETLFKEGYPNEHSLLFLPDDTALCLLRRDGGTKTGQLGFSRPPYTTWTWKDLGTQIGGPHMLRLPDGRIVAAVRLYDKKVRTSLCWLDPQAGKLTEFLPLPSGGDTSYAGLGLQGDQLLVSYYSSHEGKTCIYLAKARV